MSELTKSAKMDGTLRSPLAAMVILCHQLVINFLIGADQPNLDLCRQLIQPLANKYPNVKLITTNYFLLYYQILGCNCSVFVGSISTGQWPIGRGPPII